MSEQQGRGGGWPHRFSWNSTFISCLQSTVCHSSRKQRGGSLENSLWSFGQMATGELFPFCWCFTSFVWSSRGNHFSYGGVWGGPQMRAFCYYSTRCGKTIVYVRACVCASVCFLGAWTFLWFVCFCLLASQWGRTHDVRGIPQDAARATVAFSFFSIATWVSSDIRDRWLIVVAFCRLKFKTHDVFLHDSFTRPVRFF